MSTIAGPVTKAREGFWHEALFYDGDDEFVDHAAGFVDDGLRLGEPVLVVAARPKVDALRARLGADVEGVTYADMRPASSSTCTRPSRSA